MPSRYSLPTLPLSPRIPFFLSSYLSFSYSLTLYIRSPIIVYLTPNKYYLTC